MDTNPDVAVALIVLSASDFSRSAINALFRVCITAAGVEWETPHGLELIARLWESDSVISAIEALQDDHEANRDTAPARRRLLEMIDSEIGTTVE